MWTSTQTSTRVSGSRSSRWRRGRRPGSPFTILTCLPRRCRPRLGFRPSSPNGLGRPASMMCANDMKGQSRARLPCHPPKLRSGLRPPGRWRRRGHSLDQDAPTERILQSLPRPRSSATHPQTGSPRGIRDHGTFAVLMALILPPGDPGGAALRPAAPAAVATEEDRGRRLRGSWTSRRWPGFVRQRAPRMRDPSRPKARRDHRQWSGVRVPAAEEIRWGWVGCHWCASRRQWTGLRRARGRDHR